MSTIFEMKNYLQIFFLLIFAYTYVGCSTDGDSLENGILGECPELSIGNAEDHYQSNNPYGIDSIYMTGSCINFEVTYSGGCEEHDFDLWWDKSYENILNNEIKSVKTVLYLVHNSNYDLCEARIEETHSFDVNSIRHTNFPEVVIEVFSTDSNYVYQYRY